MLDIFEIDVAIIVRVELPRLSTVASPGDYGENLIRSSTSLYKSS